MYGPCEIPATSITPAAGLAAALRVLEARAAGLVGPRTAVQQLQQLLQPLLDGQPLRVDWSGLNVAVDRGEPAVITGVTADIPVAIAVQAADQRRLALLLSDALYAPDLECALCGCVDVAGAEADPVWVCGPACALARVTWAPKETNR
ncbi:hypothetical protein [Streptomyces carpaticus]|uniref:hypothetical protein n=1 Tax=Streptomyces carpaticus TaxID=285558 RepID=UPI0031F79A94